MDDGAWIGLLAFAFGGLLLAIGLVGGEIPFVSNSMFRTADRELDPVGFWIAAAFYGLIATFGLITFVRSFF